MHLPVRCNTCITFYHITRTPHRRTVVSAFLPYILSTGPCSACSAGLNQLLNQSRPVGGGGNLSRTGGAVPGSAPRWPRLNSPARTGRKTRLLVVPDGIRFETGKLMPARGQRPGAPGRSIAVSGSQRSFPGLAYIGRLDWQSILMKSAAHVRAFNKFNMPPFISARA